MTYLLRGFLRPLPPQPPPPSSPLPPQLPPPSSPLPPRPGRAGGGGATQLLPRPAPPRPVRRGEGAGGGGGGGGGGGAERCRAARGSGRRSPRRWRWPPGRRRAAVRARGGMGGRGGAPSRPARPLRFPRPPPPARPPRWPLGCLHPASWGCSASAAWGELEDEGAAAGRGLGGPRGRAPCLLRLRPPQAPTCTAPAPLSGRAPPPPPPPGGARVPRLNARAPY